MIYDYLIVGAGPIGMFLGIALAKLNYNVAIVEGKASLSDGVDPLINANRLYALSSGSLQYFRKYLKLSRKVFRAQTINKIRVAELATSQALTFDPRDIGAKDFGLMVFETDLLKVFVELARDSAGLTMLHGMNAGSIEKTDIGVRLICTNDNLEAKNIIISNGKHSKLRDILGIEYDVKDFKQIAFVGNIRHQKPHLGTAVEHFTSQGAFAMLPTFSPNISSLVWAMPEKFYSTLRNIDNALLTELIAYRMAGIYGDIEICSDYKFFPLKMSIARQYMKDGCILIGDALHAIHPLAGQGLNLSMRDAAALIDIIAESKALGLDLSQNIMLEDYFAERYLDNSLLSTVTVGLDTLFSNNVPACSTLRSLGIELFDTIPFLKRIMMKYASGM